jgi:hypothetical protein
LLARSPAFPCLKELFIHGHEVGAAELAVLTAAPFWQSLTALQLRGARVEDEGTFMLAHAPRPAALRRLDLPLNGIGPEGARALADGPLCSSLTRLKLSGNPVGDSGVESLTRSSQLGSLRRLELWNCGITSQGAKALLAWPHLDHLSCLVLGQNQITRKTLDQLHTRIEERLYYELLGSPVDAREIILRVKAQPPHCLRGLGAQTDTELLRRLPRERVDPTEYASVSFQLTHPDPQQKPILLSYREYGPYAVRWEPAGEQREFFGPGQHGLSGEGNQLNQMRGRDTDRYQALADQFSYFHLDAYCASQDQVIEIASHECGLP